MGVNFEEFARLREFMQQEPRRIAMKSWAARGKEAIERYFGDDAPPEIAECGTAGCIAGLYAMMIGKLEFGPNGDWQEKVYGSPREIAACGLGLTEDQAIRLFAPEYWDEENHAAYWSAKTTGERLAAVLQYFDKVVESCK
ncbi:MAG: hypothetical protein ACRD2L_04665 [Terriglobia bacterium]